MVTVTPDYIPNHILKEFTMTEVIDKPETEGATSPQVRKRRAQKMAEWVAEADYKDFDAETVEFTKALLLKTVAGMVAGCREPISRILSTYYAEQGGAPDCGLVGAGYRSSVENAAYANATFAHGSELEDNEMPSITSAFWMFPALLTVAQKQTSSGKDVITSCIVAWEICSRFNRAAPGKQLMMEHFAPPSWFGPIANGAAVSKLLKLDALRTEHAMTIAGSAASGLGQAGCDTHFLESGHTAEAGVKAAYLAKAGATAELGLLEINAGIFAPVKSFNQIDLSILDADLGVAPWSINQAAIKKYSACTFAHTSVDALEALKDEHGFTYDDVEKVEARKSLLGHLAVGGNPRPIDLQTARFSVHYLLAEVLLKGKITIATFDDLSTLDDPLYVEAMSKIESTMQPEESMDPFSPGGEVFVHLKNGQVLSKRLEHWIGSPDHPLTTEEIRQICRPYLELGFDSETVDRIEFLILNLEQQRDVLELMEILTYGRVGRRS